MCGGSMGGERVGRSISSGGLRRSCCPSRCLCPTGPGPASDPERDPASSAAPRQHLYEEWAQGRKKAKQFSPPLLNRSSIWVLKRIFLFFSSVSSSCQRRLWLQRGHLQPRDRTRSCHYCCRWKDTNSKCLGRRLPLQNNMSLHHWC